MILLFDTYCFLFHGKKICYLYGITKRSFCDTLCLILYLFFLEGNLLPSFLTLPKFTIILATKIKRYNFFFYSQPASSGLRLYQWIVFSRMSLSNFSLSPLKSVFILISLSKFSFFIVWGTIIEFSFSLHSTM